MGRKKGKWGRIENGRRKSYIQNEERTFSLFVCFLLFVCLFDFVLFCLFVCLFVLFFAFHF